jgi:hypothetical protein
MALVFELCNLRPGIAKVEHSVTGWLGYGSMPTKSWPGADIRTCFCFQFSKALPMRNYQLSFLIR